MTTVEFFKLLLKEGSIDALLNKYPSLTNDEVEKYFKCVFDKCEETSNMYELFTDGASKGNPGHSGIGFVIKKDGTIIEENSEYIGVTTNNVAEYSALISGLKRLLELDIKSVRAYSDSELMVKQINGDYSVKDDKLKKLYLEVRKLINSFDFFSLEHVLRDKNKLADKLSKDGSLNYST